MKIFTQAEDGDVIHPIHKGYKLCCCDCGLVHDIDFAIVRKTDIQPNGAFIPEPVEDPTLQVVFIPRRNVRATAAKRRWKRIRGWKGLS